MDAEKVIKELLKKEVNCEITLEIPPDTKLGDFAFPCFSLAKEFKKAPPIIAQELANKLKPAKPIKEIKAVGPYLNFFIDRGNFAEETLKELFEKKEEYGRAGKKEKIMVEFSSPNTNKPLHLGHVRNCVIGEAVSNILKFTGNDVVKACLVNDKGIHICKSMLAYKKWGNNKEPDVKPDIFVGNFYVLFAQKEAENPAVAEEAQEMLKKWESNDKETTALWKKMNKWVYTGFNETYKKLGVKFDKTYYESKIYKKGKDIILDGLKRGIFQKEEDAVVANFTDKNIPKKVLIRGDGTTIYITQDIYLAKLKFEEFSLDESVYVVASEQNLHFKQLFAILEMLGYNWAKRCRHLSYGMVYLPEGKMKSREGKVVDADDLMREMEELARFNIKERHKELKEKEIEKRAHSIGVGAIKFYMLKFDVAKDITYDPKESISFEGETGPYVQYTYARCSSILRKHKGKVKANVDYSLYNEKEQAIITKLADFPEVAAAASSHYKPHLICRYLIELCQSINEYYHAYPVLKEENKIRDARLLLIYCAKNIIGNGLNLLGIDVIEEM